MDMGAYVVVINAEQVTVTGNKPDGKLYFRHVNGRPGSWKTETFNELQRVSVGAAVALSVLTGGVCLRALLFWVGWLLACGFRKFCECNVFFETGTQTSMKACKTQHSITKL
jgi:hypothetical protein